MEPIDAVFRSWQLGRGRCFGSKSAYRRAHPQALYFPNAWVGDPRGKLWFGDLDLTGPDLSCLQQVAKELGLTLYVLSEQVFTIEGDEVERQAEVIVTGTEATLTRSAALNLPPALKGESIRLTRSQPVQ